MSSKNTNTKPLQIPRQRIYKAVEKKKTLSLIAEDIGISQSYLSLILNGHRRLNPLNKFHQKIYRKLQTI